MEHTSLLLASAGGSQYRGGMLPFLWRVKEAVVSLGGKQLTSTNCWLRLLVRRDLRRDPSARLWPHSLRQLGGGLYSVLVCYGDAGGVFSTALVRHCAYLSW